MLTLDSRKKPLKYLYWQTTPVGTLTVAVHVPLWEKDTDTNTLEWMGNIWDIKP